MRSMNRDLLKRSKARLLTLYSSPTLPLLHVFRPFIISKMAHTMSNNMYSLVSRYLGPLLPSYSPPPPSFEDVLKITSIVPCMAKDCPRTIHVEHNSNGQVTIFAFCSRKCGRKTKTSSLPMRSNKVCGRKGCDQMAYVNHGKTYTYCGQRCAELDDRARAVVALTLMTPSDPAYTSVLRAFTLKEKGRQRAASHPGCTWTGSIGSDVPKNVTIIRVSMPSHFLESYRTAHDGSATRFNSYLFHGTVLRCTLNLALDSSGKLTGTPSLCSRNDCCICGILRKGFIIGTSGGQYE